MSESEEPKEPQESEPIAESEPQVESESSVESELPVEGAHNQTADVQLLRFDQLKAAGELDADKNVDRYDDVSLHISIELGRVNMSVGEVTDWREGSIVETRKLSGQPMEIMVNGRLFGRGEVVVVGDNLAIRITDLIKPQLE